MNSPSLYKNSYAKPEMPFIEGDTVIQQDDGIAVADKKFVMCGIDKRLSDYSKKTSKVVNLL